jgi:pimeloyl-ACP methyl ester carboxylesterase
MPEAKINGYLHHWEEAGSGEPLVMIHGSDTSSKTLVPHLPELSKTFRVVIPDLRGFGASERHPNLHPKAWIEDIVALAQHLGLDRFHLYGVSLGSRIVLRIAIEHPELLRSLIVQQPIIANTPEGNAVLNARYVDPDDIPQETKELHQDLHGDDWRTVLRNYFAIRNSEDFQRYFTLHDEVKQITTPTLIMRHDVHEPVHPMAQAFELWESIKGSRLWIRPALKDGTSGLFAPEGYGCLRELIEMSAVAPVGA